MSSLEISKAQDRIQQTCGMMEACDKINKHLNDLVNSGYIPPIAIKDLFNCTLVVWKEASAEYHQLSVRHSELLQVTTPVITVPEKEATA